MIELGATTAAASAHETIRVPTACGPAPTVRLNGTKDPRQRNSLTI